MLRPIRACLAQTRVQLVLYLAVICFACWLRREVLSSEFLADDYAQLGMLDGAYPLKRATWDLFTFSNGQRAEGERLMALGFYPWWADPTVRISMFRPFASAMIALDFRQFGNVEWLHHLHSLCWWIVLLGVVAWSFRRWLTPSVAALAFLLFCCANAHGLALAWICNRSAIMATLLALLSLHFYVRGRASLSWRDQTAAIALFCLALGFGEYALCTAAYFFAFEACRRDGSLRDSARALSPFAGAGLLFLWVRSALGLSMQRSGVYVDAVTEPLEFLNAVAQRIPVFLSDLSFALRSDYWTFGAPPFGIGQARGTAFARFFEPAGWRILHQCVGLIAGALLLWLWRALGRDTQAKSTRWLLLGAILSLIPVCGSFPSSRLTLAACFGFMPQIAILIDWGLTRSRGAKLLAVTLLSYLVLVPSMQQRDEAQGFMHITRRTKRDILALNVDEQQFRSQDVLVMGALDGGLSTYLPLTRQRYSRSAPHACWVLSFVASPYSLERDKPNGFRIRFYGMNTAGSSITEQLFRRPELPFHIGDTTQVGALRVTVSELLDGKPKTLSFELDRSLDDPSLLFLFSSSRGYQRFRMPPLGESVVVPTPTLTTLPDELVDGV